jgi:hypothetical protein
VHAVPVGQTKRCQSHVQRGVQIYRERDKRRLRVNDFGKYGKRELNDLDALTQGQSGVSRELKHSSRGLHIAQALFFRKYMMKICDSGA